jgi:saccharopine dehydrogenase-like NADP-dependent oxidoreductase
MGYFSDEKIDAGKKTINANDLSEILLSRMDDANLHLSALRELGFFDLEEYGCFENCISPKEISAKVLSRKWKMLPDDKDILVMRVQADDDKTRYVADIYAEHNGLYSAMALTTGGTAVLATRAILEKEFNVPGLFPLEKAVKINPGFMDYFIKGLEKLGVSYSQSKSELNQDNQF